MITPCEPIFHIGAAAFFYAFFQVFCSIFFEADCQYFSRRFAVVRLEQIGCFLRQQFSFAGSWSSYNKNVMATPDGLIRCFL